MIIRKENEKKIWLRWETNEIKRMYIYVMYLTYMWYPIRHVSAVSKSSPVYFFFFIHFTSRICGDLVAVPRHVSGVYYSLRQHILFRKQNFASRIRHLFSSFYHLFSSLFYSFFSFFTSRFRRYLYYFCVIKW